MTTFTITATQPRNDLHISKREDGVYVNQRETGTVVYLKQGDMVTVLTSSGFSIFESDRIVGHGELFPAKYVHVSARMWGPYEE
ncbi:hypothetical protein [Pseudomonas phage PSA34]|uniref:Uncharacterized protein n=1 Tax=Pseudomonas phage LUZ24 TaxID=484895 RepID=A9J6V1_BPLUZ|nr:hypothetical protein PPLUZ24_gp10 [Bruynoghevirus LUZ24]QVJ12849.1 hypothetical protein [Pseudomonas phage PSA16]QVJ13281.1 hypothetical protein [Pseudomonas phage PSA31]QVJ13315.1 hypothetical protein [Pseudomonas phage PSA34]QVJ13426.1 hypothetical protein [Pseudomonas phage PSA37]QVJ13546.1 hypothetical protein [Pseudomonas phage PSA40]UFK26564.1 hypothetical protein PaPSe_gp64 [Pseudomonas phage PaP_Se]UVN13126.1 hypothetical protein FBPa5_0041 [Pseudomonas phage vB_PaeM_FBPa5]